MSAHRDQELVVSDIAAAIAAPARARMLYCLADGRARTGTELALVGEVSASTASLHLQLLARRRLVRARADGRRRYYALESPRVAAALESLAVLANGSQSASGAHVPEKLRAARTCYDHLAGILGVSLYDSLVALGWLVDAPGNSSACDLSSKGAEQLERLGVEVDAHRTERRRFAYGCMDWSERRPHLAGSLGAALCDLALKKRWVLRERDSRALVVTALGRRELRTRFGVDVEL